MTKRQSSYLQIMKTTSIFGGVQVFQILIQIIRSKFITVLLGPNGIGIFGLLNSTIGLISGFTNLGLGTSAIKSIATAYENGSEKRISVIVLVLKRIVCFSGIFGALITLVLSPWLSKLTFGNNDFTLSFIWISITLLFNQISSGQLGILQGMRKINYLAKANLYGSVIGLIITIPLYYKFRIDGIVPSIIISSLLSLLLSSYFIKKIDVKPVKVSVIRTIAEGKNMITMGFVISLTVLISLLTSYLLRIFISRIGGIADVGLYTAGITIVTTYVGMIFNAMGGDFFARLSSVSSDKKVCFLTINQQAEVAILVLAPILVLFFIMINYVIVVLYSDKFIPINIMILWAALGMFFRVIIWIMGFLYLVNGGNKTYFWNEFISTIYTLFLNLFGYYIMGLTGIGISMFIAYLITMIQSLLIGKIKYCFKFNDTFIRIFVIHFFISIIGVIVAQFVLGSWRYLLGVLLIIASFFYSYFELNKRIGLRNIIANRLKIS